MLEAIALANLRLYQLGYSPLTAEAITAIKAAGGSARTASVEDGVRLQHRRDEQRAEGGLEQSDDPTLDDELKSATVLGDREVLERLVDAVPKLPPQSLARAKAALALGVGFLRGAERAAQTGGSTGAGREPESLRSPPGRSANFGTMNAPNRSTNSTTRRRERRRYRRGTGSASVIAVADGDGGVTIADELRAAESLLFESACILEQRSSAQPVDLPLFVEQRWAELGCVGVHPFLCAIIIIII